MKYIYAVTKNVLSKPAHFSRLGRKCSICKNHISSEIVCSSCFNKFVEECEKMGLSPIKVFNWALKNKKPVDKLELMKLKLEQ